MASMLARTVHFLVGGATLLSGGLDDCMTPFDASCEAGISNLDALMRNLTADEPTLLLPLIDRDSRFVQMHPLGWAVNRLIYQEMLGLKVFSSAPSLLQQNKLDGISSRDLSFLQSDEFPLLLSNVAVPPSNSWSAYQIPLYLDEETGLAVMSIINDGEVYNVDHIDNTIGLLNDIERYNRQSGCYGDESDQSTYNSYFNRTSVEKKCWIPVVVYFEVRTSFETWFTAVANHEFPPALVVNIEEEIEKYAEPTLVDGVWAVSYEIKQSQYDQITLQIGEGGRSIEKVEFLSRDMTTIPDELKDESYVRLQTFLRQLAIEAVGNDPVVGHSVEVPVQRSGTYRRCKSGMCEIGNLYTDAIRWYTMSDIAFQGSGGFRGSGWDAGEVKVSDIWDALPFNNRVCTGVISGANMFQLFNYSLYHSTFEGENTRDGGLLLQVSGMRLSFNLQLPTTTRIVKMEIWDEETNTYSDVDRNKLYSFATDSFICSIYGSYPILLGEESLDAPDEVPGFIGDTPIVQFVVADYLAQFQDTPYDHSIPGARLVNRTDLFEPLSFIQMEDDCLKDGDYWEASTSTCMSCSNNASVAILGERLEFDAEDNHHACIKLVNIVQSNVGVLFKMLPTYIFVESVVDEAGNPRDFNAAEPKFLMLPGEMLTLNFAVDFKSLEPGTVMSSVILGVGAVGNPMCSRRGITFEVYVRNFPPEELNQLGTLRYAGFSLTAIACSLALAATAWVATYREKQVVKVMQPIFLCAISTGVFIMALAIIPTSLDDEIVSQNHADMACMAIPWFLSMGFTISLSALFTKLWRIHRLFSATRRGRRVSLKPKDVIAPFAIMFLLNISVLLVWTLWNPRKYKRIPVLNEPWNSYGNCESEDETLGMVLMALAGVVNLFPLAAASYMAYQVRNVSDEFSEAKRVGLALFIWVQFVLVGGPMYFLIKSDNPRGRYFLEIGTIFLVSISMLSLIFLPIIQSKLQHSKLYSQANITESAQEISENNEQQTMSESFHKEHYEPEQLTGGSSGQSNSRVAGLNDRNRLSNYTLRQKGPKVTGVNWAGFPNKHREVGAKVSNRLSPSTDTTAELDRLEESELEE